MGRNIEATNLLRSKQGGRLKSQVINGEEYPEFLFAPREMGQPAVFKAEFEGLFEPAFITDVILQERPRAADGHVFRRRPRAWQLDDR